MPWWRLGCTAPLTECRGGTLSITAAEHCRKCRITRHTIFWSKTSVDRTRAAPVAPVAAGGIAHSICSRGSAGVVACACDGEWCVPGSCVPGAGARVGPTHREPEVVGGGRPHYRTPRARPDGPTRAPNRARFRCRRRGCDPSTVQGIDCWMFTEMGF